MSDDADNNFFQQPNIIDIRLGRIIAKLRAEQKLSVQSLASVMGLSELELAMMERGKRKFREEHLEALDHYFHLNLRAVLVPPRSQTDLDNQNELPSPTEQSLILLRHFTKIKSSSLRRAVIDHTLSLLRLDGEIPD